MNRARLAAWTVHLYTANGAVLAFLALVAVSRHEYGMAFTWLTVAMLVDCTDGTLARWARVKGVLPHFDGSRLDDIVDYSNYVLVPVVLAHSAGLFPQSAAGSLVAAAPLLASAYGFCQAEAKTADHFFTGFPSYWNVVVLYLYTLRGPMWFNVATVITLSILVFVPFRYFYPSRSTTARAPTYALGTVWAVMVALLLLQFPNPSRTLAILSLFFPAYYVALSLRLHFWPPTVADEQGATRNE